MEDKMVWVCGEYLLETAKGGVWYLVGVYDNQKSAEEACVTSKHFVGPVAMNGNKKKATAEDPWPGAYYPMLNQSQHCETTEEN